MYEWTKCAQTLADTGRNRTLDSGVLPLRFRFIRPAFDFEWRHPEERAVISGHEGPALLGTWNLVLGTRYSNNDRLRGRYSNMIATIFTGLSPALVSWCVSGAAMYSNSPDFFVRTLVGFFAISSVKR